MGAIYRCFRNAKLKYILVTSERYSKSQLVLNLKRSILGILYTVFVLGVLACEGSNVEFADGLTSRNRIAPVEMMMTS